MSCTPYTLDFAKDRLAKYYEAEERVLNGQKYQIGGRSLERADLAEIRNGIQLWEGRVNRLCKTGHTGPTMRRIIPHG